MFPSRNLSKFARKLQLRRTGKHRQASAPPSPEPQVGGQAGLSTVEEEGWSDYEEVSREEATDARQEWTPPVAGSQAAPDNTSNPFATPSDYTQRRSLSNTIPRHSHASSLRARARPTSRASLESNGGQRPNTLGSELKIILDFPLPPSASFDELVACNFSDVGMQRLCPLLNR